MFSSESIVDCPQLLLMIHGTEFQGDLPGDGICEPQVLVADSQSRNTQIDKI